MVRKDGAEARKERIQKVAKFILASLEANNGKIPLGKAVAKIAIDMGLTTERIMEYLTILENADYFVLDIEGDKIKKIES